MSCHHVVPLRGRGADIMTRAIVSVGLCLWAGWVQAAFIAWTLDANMTRFRVPVATNTEFSLTNNPFQSDSLARSASGTLYSADPVGMIWDVTCKKVPVKRCQPPNLGKLGGEAIPILPIFGG